MIEFPEAVTIARQIAKELDGRTITSCAVNQSPHKFAFYSYELPRYPKVMVGQTVGSTSAAGSHIRIQIGGDHTLVLGDGGERIFLHEDEKSLPTKHQLLLEFDDGRLLTVSISAWGAVLLFTPQEYANHQYFGHSYPDPLSDDYSLGFFQDQFAALDPEDKRSLKKFVISDPKINGIANGYLQDVLYRARLHPRRRAVETTHAEQESLYQAVRTTLTQAIDLGGRDTEKDLYTNPGGYIPLMDRRTKGTPCTVCGALIEKASYLGGSIYFCPSCQT